MTLLVSLLPSYFARWNEGLVAQVVADKLPAQKMEFLAKVENKETGLIYEVRLYGLHRRHPEPNTIYLYWDYKELHGQGVFDQNACVSSQRWGQEIETVVTVMVFVIF